MQLDSDLQIRITNMVLIIILQVYKQNPYDPASSISSTYSSTTTILNVDTASLELQSASGFYGYITTGMKLIGQSSGAIATSDCN